MKTMISIFFRRLLLVLCFLFSSIKGFSQTHITMSLLNCATNSNTTLEFDLYIVNDGTTQIDLRAASFGIYYDPVILNGGIPPTTAFTFQTGSEDPLLTILNPYILKNDLPIHQLRLNMSPIFFPQAPTLVPNVQYRIGRFTFTNTVNWAPNSNPAISLQLANQAGVTVTEATVYLNGNVPVTLDITGVNRDGIVACPMILNSTPNITGFTPSHIAAGNGEILTIDGSGFGYSRGSGNIFFQDVVNPGGSLVPLEPFDWANPLNPAVTWTNDKIQVILPSSVSGGAALLGSGSFQIKTSSGNSFITSAPINIDYALTAEGSQKKKPRLVRNNCDNNPYTFFFQIL